MCASKLYVWVRKFICISTLVAFIFEGDALDNTDRNNLEDRSTLTGIINELTALALLNRRQSPERMAIPSDITADLYRATDLNYSLFKKGDEACGTST